MNDLTGVSFMGRDYKEYIVLAGCANSAICFVERDNPEEPLWFACEASVKNSMLYSSCNFSYTVNKEEFFGAIDVNDPINSLTKKYYQLPRSFAELVVEVYMKEKVSKL